MCRSRTGKAEIVDIGDSSNFRKCLASPPFLNPAHILVCDLSAPFGDRCQHCGALLHMRPVHAKDHRSQGRRLRVRAMSFRTEAMEEGVPSQYIPLNLFVSLWDLWPTRLPTLSV